LSLDASTGVQTTAAAVGDTLNVIGVTTINVNTLSSSGTVVANAVTVGTGSGYANTAQGMIDAINNSGLGVTASFTTAAVAGASVAGSVPADDTAAALTNTGIMISGSVGVGATPTSASFSGSATATGAVNGDILTGSVTFQVGNTAATTVTMAQVATATDVAQGAVTMGDLKSYINANAALGVTAGDSTSGTLTFASSAASDPALKVTSNLTDTSIAAGPTALTYTATSAYSDGISTGTFATTGITDSTTAQLTPSDVIQQGTASSGGGIATISYTDKSGQSLSGTDLSTQADAETALTSLNAAITDVAAQDGYVGAQINTLNAVSSVLSTQQENVTSAQNAVQATDYASATSNMSKYEILSQTGISALAQANSMSQEVTKLLQ
jgi:flagellin